MTILYRDIRTYGLMERYYTQARNQGIEFIQYELDAKPDLSLKEGGLQLKVKDRILGEEIILQPDLVVLASAIVPYENEALAKMLKVPLTADGFFLEAHMKLRPVDFATDGIFLAGLAHFPKTISESISQADAAVARATASIAKGYVNVLPTISEVDQTRCIGCGLCELLCPFSAIRVVETEKGSKAETIAASCKGCGVCSASCTQKAVTVHHFTDEQLSAQIEALLPVREKKQPNEKRILDFRFSIYSERLNEVVIARSKATCLRAEALRRASVAISWDCFTSFAMKPRDGNLFITFTIKSKI